MASRELSFRVEKTREGSPVAVGSLWDTVASTIVIGRDTSADFRLNDSTVSRRHIRLTVDDDTIALENLSSKGAAFVDQTRLDPGGSTQIESESFHLQIGRVLLRVEFGAATAAFDDPMSLVASPAVKAAMTGPFVTCRWDAGRCHILVNGALIEMFPAAAQLFAALCETPGRPVHHMDLQETVGPNTNLEQQISYARKAWRELIDAGLVDAELIRDRVKRLSSNTTDIDTLDTAGLMRRFIASQRGFGYVLFLQMSDVLIDDGTG
ncbi:MAG: hypothetical protein ACJAYU_000094 [Bradymonadia bacterium]|jgi:hypothetical protein